MSRLSSNGSGPNVRRKKKKKKEAVEQADAGDGKAATGNEAQSHQQDYFDQWITHYSDFYAEHSRLDCEFRLSRMLVLAGRSWTKRIDNILRIETGQSRARWQALFTLGFAEQPVTMTELCKRERVQWPTMVRVIDGMARDGLVRREDNPSDGRSKLVYMTVEGRDMMVRIQQILDRERAQLLARLTCDELMSCTNLLERIFENAVAP